MRHVYFAIYASALLFAPLPALANECWAISNIKGYSANADQGYKYVKDGMQNILVCFSPDGGTVTGTDIGFIKFGQSTLAGYGGNDKGNELFEVYQLDREKKKLLYVKTRIGTKTVAPVFSDVVSSFVGDAKKVSE
jgi:hypothetical protein